MGSWWDLHRSYRCCVCCYYCCCCRFISLSLALSFVRLATEFSLLSDTGPCWDIYKNFRVFVGGKAAVAVGLLLLVASIFLSYSLPAPRRLFTSYLVDPASSI